MCDGDDVDVVGVEYVKKCVGWRTVAPVFESVGRTDVGAAAVAIAFVAFVALAQNTAVVAAVAAIPALLKAVGGANLVVDAAGILASAWGSLGTFVGLTMMVERNEWARSHSKSIVAR